MKSCGSVSWLMIGVGLLLCWVIFANNFLGSSGIFHSLMEAFSPKQPAAWCPDGVGSNFGSTCNEITDTNIASYADNRMSPEQCALGATYSGSGGCVVLTDAQKNFLATRGGNRTSETPDNAF